MQEVPVENIVVPPIYIVLDQYIIEFLKGLASSSVLPPTQVQFYLHVASTVRKTS